MADKRLIDKKCERALDFNGNPIGGTWDVEFSTNPEKDSKALTRGVYSFILDYGSTSLDGTEDAYQFAGDIVVGKYPIIYCDPILVPWDVSGVTNDSEIETLIKKNTTFDISISTVDPDTEMTGIQGLPLNLYFRRGSLLNYGGNNTDEMYDELKQSSVLTNANVKSTIKKGDINTDVTPNVPYPSSEYGNVYFKNIKVGDIYPNNDQIQTLNTLFIQCQGTKNRDKNDNYLPYLVYAPLVLGTRHVFLKIRGLQDTTMKDTRYVCGVRGGGSLAFSVNTYEAFAIDGNKTTIDKVVAKFGLYDWISKPEKFVHAGYYTVQEKVNGLWQDIPANRIHGVENDISTRIDGEKIYHAGTDTRQIQLVVSNAKPVDYDGEWSIRLYFHGVVGTYYDEPTEEWIIQVKPTNGSYDSVKMNLYYQDLLNTYMYNTTHECKTEILTQTGASCGLDGVLIVEIEKVE